MIRRQKLHRLSRAALAAALVPTALAAQEELPRPGPFLVTIEASLGTSWIVGDMGETVFTPPPPATPSARGVERNSGQIVIGAVARAGWERGILAARLGLHWFRPQAIAIAVAETLEPEMGIQVATLGLEYRPFAPKMPALGSLPEGQFWNEPYLVAGLGVKRYAFDDPGVDGLEVEGSITDPTAFLGIGLKVNTGPELTVALEVVDYVSRFSMPGAPADADPNIHHDIVASIVARIPLTGRG